MTFFPQADIRYSLKVTWNNLNQIDFIIGLDTTHKAPTSDSSAGNLQS